ncbi:MAG: sugar ABC transporter permease, partial [Chloroflexi bacterium]|nr:sugar ABC transporter permease [Chloroflexota bacterium]
MEIAAVLPVAKPATRRFKWLPDTLSGYAFVGLPLALLVAFYFFPLARAVYLSLFATNPLGEPTLFVGLEQYALLLSSGDFLRNLGTTLLFGLYVVPVGLVFSLAIALLANQRLPGVAIFRTIVSSTIGISIVAATLVWSVLFNPGIGELNYLISFVGAPPVGWLTDPRWALPSLAVFTIWKDLGFNVIVLMGGLQGIPAELHEAASIDGAGGWN